MTLVIILLAAVVAFGFGMGKLLASLDEKDAE